MNPPTIAVLDTSVVIDPVADLSGRAETFCVAAVTLAELQFGVASAVDAAVLASRQLRYLEVLHDLTPVPYTELVAHWHGTFMAMDEQAGRNPRTRMADLVIAATAKTLGAFVITRNPGDFRSVEGIVPIVAV